SWLRNGLVIAAHAASDVMLDIKRGFIKPGFNLAGALKGGRLAMADPDSGVPAGKYGKIALQNLGVWASVESSVLMAEHVHAAMRLVSGRVAPLGILYATCVAADPNTKVAGVFPEDTHPAIVYQIALTTKANTPVRRGCSNFSCRPARRLFLSN